MGPDWDSEQAPAFTPPPPPPSQRGPRGGELPHPGAPSELPVRTARLPFAAAILATALLAGGLGAAITLVVAKGTPAGRTVGVLPPRSGTVTGTGGADVAAIAARVLPATVDISAVGPQVGQYAGTGIIIASAGLVLTNNHVIEGSTQVSAQVNGSGPIYPATVVGTDPTMDIALLQLHGAKKWKAVTVGSARPVAVGDAVVAIGNALDLPGPETVTTGTISSVGRSVTVNDPLAGAQEQLTGMLQTSAAISSGNSGGPLVDSLGAVIGITTAAAPTGGPGEPTGNIGFAIPISVAMSVAHQIEAGKPTATVHIGSPAATGLALTSVPCADGLGGCLPLGFGDFGEAPFGGLGIYQAPTSAGAVVAAIEQGCPAAGSGLHVGDVITEFDGHAVTSPDQVDAIVSTLEVGDRVRADWVGQNGKHYTGRFELVQGPNL